MRYLLTIGMVWFAALFTLAQDRSAYTKHIFTSNDKELPYRLLSPLNNTGKKFPLIIFLHGAFERGNDNESQLNIGGRFFLRDSIRLKYPAYVLFPQCPADITWAYFENQVDYTTGYAKDWNFPFRKEPAAVSALLKKLIDQLIASGSIDVSRIYIAGLSQGGMGVLDLIARYPETFAAGISICGAGEPATTKLFAGKVALWLFHGSKDPVVPKDFSQQFYKRLKREGSVVRYSEYSGVEHNSWVNAFAEPELMSWLFMQGKLSRP
ncbi:MAG: prolyl oligopeptidase family serine peptidase [Sediminibacterium sp.]